MNIYLVERKNSSDNYFAGFDSFVCVANSAYEAQKMHPQGDCWNNTYKAEANEDGDFVLKNKTDGKVNKKATENPLWVKNIEDLKTTYLGVASEDFKKPAIVHVSYHTE